jgi:hypothetical protein
VLANEARCGGGCDAAGVRGAVGVGGVGGVADAGDDRSRVSVDGGGDDRVVEHVEVDVGAAAPYEQRDVGSVVAGELVERTGDAQAGRRGRSPARGAR